jgi:lipopolysaccharide export system protein LptA
MFKSATALLKPTSWPLIAALFALSATAWSLPGDRDQPILIKSNKAELDESKGMSIYQGEVMLEQGSIKLAADEVTIFSNQNGVYRILATGTPAHFQQIQKKNDTPIHAFGNSINYLLELELIELRENAKLEQQKNIFTGERIDYDMKQRLVNAESGPGDKTEGSRVEMVIQPNKKAPGKNP